MDREEARELLLGCSRYINEETDLWEALDLAIEALKGDLHCPKCGTIVRDGRQYHDLVYRGEAEKLQLSEETSTNSEETSTNEGDAESATTTDCISRADIEYHTQLEARGNGQYEEVEVAYKSDIDNLPSVTPTTKGVDFDNMIPVDDMMRNLPPCTHSWASTEQGTCEDCISRQQTIEAFCDDCRGLKPGQCEHWDKCKSQKVLRSLPPVTPTERTGEWVSHELWDMPWFTCSECNYHGRSDFKFCPNCGAKMGGDTE